MSRSFPITSIQISNGRLVVTIRLEFHGSKVTSDAGLLAYRDLDDTLVLFVSVSEVLSDRRKGRNVRHELETLLRYSVYSRPA